ncbi:TonB-dependent receptor [Hyphomicrobium sp. D-2]|uniref:TonB-dependent receptor domain-containing protein n=1 Tax=Hyphomicrobium sp. D-2 TaxID=3041621 RepID=UPI0024589640|nr:TonB-dependent receptor [Hyphomicrobium sp. D-2]MDH4982143.1 TonB-dependent receptor plug domain-containing protein [Hyphomicrobium sp. D-2]
MRNVRRARCTGRRSAAIVVGSAALCGLGCGSIVSAQETTELPALEVEAPKAKQKKKSAAAKKPVKSAPASADITPAPLATQAAAGKAPVTVSGEPSIGTQTTNITSADLDRLNPADIKDVFAGQPGILVGSSIPTSQKVYVNGLEETALAVTVDGAAQNNKVFHHNGTNFIDPSLLKAVRVDAGVAPADAGFGALAGSIAYETKDVVDLLDKDGFGGFLKTQFNTNGNVLTSNVAAYGMSNGVEILGYFTIGKGDDFEAGNGRTIGGTEIDYLSGLGKVAYQAQSGDRFEISHERFSDDAMRPYRANFTRPPIGAEPLYREYDIDRQTTVFSYTDATPQGWWDPTVLVAHSKTTVYTPLFDRVTGLPSPVDGVSESVNGKAENKFSFVFGSVVTGVDFTLRSAELVYPGAKMDEESDVVGAYSQARIEVFKGTRVSFGGRADHQWFTGVTGQTWTDSGVSGNISGEQDLLGEFLTAKAGYSHVWGGIPLAENFIMNPDWTYGTGPQAVEADNYTAGLVARYNGWKLEGSVFRTEIDNARIAAWTNVGFGALRVRDIISEGYELGVGYDWGDGFVRVRYANIDVSVDGKPADSDTGTYIATPVGEIITISGAHTFVGTGLTVGADAEIAPKYDNVTPGRPAYKAYKVFNAFAEYAPDLPGYDLTFRLDVRNVFNETYADRATYGQEFAIVTPLYEPGRSFILSATSKF